MSRRWLQNLCMIALFLIAFTVIVAVGIGQGIKERSVDQAGTELREKLPWEEAVKTDPSEENLPSLQDSDIVYTTPSGTKFHLDSDCSSLSHAKQIIGQTFGNVKESGKELCTFCRKRYENKQQPHT